MMVKIVEANSRYDFQKEINKLINEGNVKDIKFCVNPIIKSTGFSSFSSREMYYAMIIYE